MTGLVAQQQCVGPLHTPLANCGVVASSHLGTTGIATACGEQPVKGLLDPAAMARLTVAESLTNIMWAKVHILTAPVSFWVRSTYEACCDRGIRGWEGALQVKPEQTKYWA